MRRPARQAKATIRFGAVRALRRGAVHQEEMSGWHLDRQRLEARMAATLDADGVERDLRRGPSVVEIAGADRCGTRRRLLDRERNSSLIARAAPPLRPVPKRRFAASTGLWPATASLTLDSDVEAVAATLVEAVATGWWYMSMMPGGRDLVGLFTDSDLLPPGFRKDIKFGPRWRRRRAAVSARLASLGIDLATTARCNSRPRPR